MKTFTNYIGLLLFAASFLLFFPTGAGAQGASDKGNLRLKTVVIDAGHGGKDAGAISKDGKTYEKNVVLAIAKSFGQKIEAAYPDVKVIYTRTTDKFVELNERAAIANRNKADLFISIHINSNTSTSPSGFSAHILGQSSSNRDLFSSNLELCRRENSVILLEDDYDTKYQGYDPQDPESFIFFNLMQNAYYEQSILFASEVNTQLAKGPLKNNRGISQDPFLVLWKTTMPSVLLELGFISNANDLKILNTSSGREEIAQRIFAAFKEFKTKYDGSLDLGRRGSGDGAVSGGSAAGSADTGSGVAKSGSVTSSGSSSGSGTAKSGSVTSGGSSSGSGTAKSGSAASGSAGNSATKSGSQASSASKTGTRYGIQVFSLSRELKANDPALKGYSPEIFPSGKIYRYVVGGCSSEAEAREKLSSVRKDFPDAYIVKIVDGVLTKI